MNRDEIWEWLWQGLIKVKLKFPLYLESEKDWKEEPASGQKDLVSILFKEKKDSLVVQDIKADKIYINQQACAY